MSKFTFGTTGTTYGGPGSTNAFGKISIDFSQLLKLGFWKKYLVDQLAVSPWTWIVAIATMLGAFGGFPQPPAAFMWFTQWQIIQWFFVFVLLYQGGTGENAMMAFVLTLATFILYKIIRFFEKTVAPKETAPAIASTKEEEPKK